MDNIPKKLYRDILKKFSTTGGSLIIAGTIFAAGFVVGQYISNIFHKMEINELNMEYFQKTNDLKNDFYSELSKVSSEREVLIKKINSLENGAK